jgi:hypothetical protein
MLLASVYIVNLTVYRLQLLQHIVILARNMELLRRWLPTRTAINHFSLSSFLLPAPCPEVIAAELWIRAANKQD